MNPAWIHAAESLIPALAKGEVDDQVTLSATQSTLRISCRLVYMCGLVTQFQREAPFRRKQVEWFHHLQGLYQEEVGLSQPFYHLSPTLLPTNAVQEIIYQSVKRRQDEIEDQAAKAETILLAMEGDKTMTGHAKKAKAKADRQGRHSHGMPQGDDSGNSDESDAENANFLPIIKSTTTLDDLMKPQFTQEEHDIPATDWKEVKSKKRKAEAPVANRLVGPEAGYSANKEKKIDESGTLDFHDVEAPGVGTREWQALNEASSPVDVSLGNKVNARLSISETASPHDEVAILQTKMRQLELELARKDELLRNERAAHAKALQLEKEQSQERLQGLQLRLYISETRLQTFEDGLEEAETDSMVVVGPSEWRPWRTTRHDDEEEEASPLYSRRK